MLVNKGEKSSRTVPTMDGMFLRCKYTKPNQPRVKKEEKVSFVCFSLFPFLFPRFARVVTPTLTLFLRHSGL